MTVILCVQSSNAIEKTEKVINERICDIKKLEHCTEMKRKRHSKIYDLRKQPAFNVSIQESSDCKIRKTNTIII